MAVVLTEALLTDEKKPLVVEEVKALVDAEVASKKGPSGWAVRGGYGAVKKVSPNIVDSGVKRLLPDFLAQLEPFWQEYGQAAGDGRFADYLVARSDTVADALLSVTDARIEGSSRAAVKKVYKTMRGSAKKNVIEALPRLGELVQRNAG